MLCTRNLGLPGGRGTLKFFDKSNAIYQFDALATPLAQVPCEGCPSATGQGEPSASS